MWMELIWSLDILYGSTVTTEPELYSVSQWWMLNIITDCDSQSWSPWPGVTLTWITLCQHIFFSFLAYSVIHKDRDQRHCIQSLSSIPGPGIGKFSKFHEKRNCLNFLIDVVKIINQPQDSCSKNRRLNTLVTTISEGRRVSVCLLANSDTI